MLILLSYSCLFITNFLLPFFPAFSKPLMDLLVTLCAEYHLNPSSHTLELVTANRKNVKLKPNALIGTLDAEKIILKPKGEDKNKKTGPQMPEASYHLLIGCLLFKANNGQCPSFSCACQQAPTAQHGLTLLEFIPDRLSHIL
ncbi:hypothetical protein GOODEAATRI_021422 [Goodea atripinnis]|uniref:Uncharacterized protein n=1 Tax=Goodea atripinnis TaxID=208336 RepID=A0ABV0Q0M9_9TELE